MKQNRRLLSSSFYSEKLNPLLESLRNRQDMLYKNYPLYQLLNCLSSKYSAENSDRLLLQEAIEEIYTRISWAKWHVMSAVHQNHKSVFAQSTNCGYYVFWFCQEYILESKSQVLKKLNKDLKSIKAKENIDNEERIHAKYLEDYIENFNEDMHEYIHKTMVSIVEIRAVLAGLTGSILIGILIFGIKIKYSFLILVCLFTGLKIAPQMLWALRKIFREPVEDDHESAAKLEELSDLINAKLELYEIIISELYNNISRGLYTTVYSSILTISDLKNVIKRICHKGGAYKIVVIHMLSPKIFVNFIRFLGLDIEIAMRIVIDILHLRHSIIIAAAAFIIGIVLIIFFTTDYITPILLLTQNFMPSIFK